MPTITGTSGADSLAGGAGDDIIVGLAGADTIDGGDGNDTLYSDVLSPGWNIPWNTNPYTAPVLDIGAEADTLTGGNGQDTFYVGYGDSVSGGADTDALLISFRGATSGVTADFRPLLADGSGSIVVGGALIQGIERVLWIEGSNFDDTLYAQAEPFGWADFTPIFGLGGNDHIVGGPLSGNLYGGDGDDIVDGSLGVYGKLSYGGAGNDTILAGRGTGYGEDGNDTITTSGGAEGGAGDDILTAVWAGTQIALYGGEGNDTLNGSDQVDILHGGSGGDTIIGGAGNDELYADGGNFNQGTVDQFDHGLEHDHLEGGAGNDSLNIGYGDDADGGDGTDSLVIWTGGATSGLDVSLINNPAGFTIGGGVIKNIENLPVFAGTAFADHITIGGWLDGTMVTGGGGDDVLTVTSGGSVYFIGGLGNDTLNGGGSSDALQGDDGNDIIIGGAGNDSIHGGNGDDFLEGGDGDDNIWGREDNSPEGIDTVTYANASGAVIVNLSTALGSATGAAGNDWLNYIDNVIGSAFNDTLKGSFGVNVLEGGAGDDSLEGREGADVLKGGTGNDTYYADAEDTLTELAGEGTDTVISAVSFTLGANFERLTLSGTDNVNATGNAVDNIIIGNSGNNVIDGAAGADAMSGGAGDDTYIVDQAGDTVSENPGEGIDLVQSAVTFTLGSDVENLTLTGLAAINGTGNALANVMLGNGAANTLSGLAGNDTLDGGAGADTLNGGLGDDIYYVDDAGDLVTEAAGEGSDQVLSSITYSLTANVETLTLLGSAAINGTGNGLNNLIVGNGGNNVLTGLAGNDVLDGQGGADTMLGGLGNDTYYVDNAADVATEAAGEGTDTVITSVSYTLAAGTEIDVLMAVDPAAAVSMDLTGNEFGQQILGNVGANQINGGGGNDSLTGYGGDDTLDGGTGADLMEGGVGNDHYYVDNVGDIVVEGADFYIDYVHAQIGTYTLTANVEGLIFVNDIVTLGTGNDLKNWITGPATAAATIYGLGGDDEIHTGSGADTIDGGSGADWMYGGAGNDTYYVDNMGDVVVEDSLGGTDQVFASVSYGLFSEAENLFLTGTGAINGSGNSSANVIQGNSGANQLSGFGGDDSLSGQGGDDALDGGDGNDTLDGGDGNDTLDGAAGLDTASYALASAGVTVSLTAVGAQNTAGAGNDTLTNIENLTGSEFDDILTGSAGANVLSGLGGNDRLDGGAGNDTLNGGAGVDTASYAGATSAVTVNLSLATAQNTIGAGTDTLSSIENLLGSGFADTLTGDANANVIEGGAGNDLLNGGAGTDTASYAGATSAVTVNLGLATAQNTLGAGSDTLSNFENLLGSAFNDTLTGNASANVLEGGAGNDTLNGGAGLDTASYASAASGVTVSLALAGAQNTVGAGTDTLTAMENLSGSAWTDTLTGDGNANVLSGLGGDDVIDGGAGTDTLDGGAGNDTASYASAIGGVTVDLQVAAAQNTVGAGTDTLSNFENLAGSAFADTLIGNSGTNLLSGGTGNDWLIGVGGDDVLTGGAGVDELTGGTGNDTFRDSAAGLNGDTIDDLMLGESIVITDATLAGFSFSQTGTTLTYTGGSLTLAGPPHGVLVASAAAGGGVQLTLMDSGPTEGDDTLTGTEQDDVINGLGGNDIISGLSGNDTLDGGIGNDSLNGGNDNDTLIGNYGDDTLDGGAGDDSLDGGPGFDKLIGGDGVDSLDGGVSGDTYIFRSGAEHPAAEIHDSGNDWDVVQFAATTFGTLTLFAGDTGIDAVGINDGTPGGGFAAANIDASAVLNGLTIGGNIGGNTLKGTAFNDVLQGNAGNDTLEGGGGDDSLDGGADVDTASYASASSAVTVSLAIAGAQNTGAAGFDTFVSIENLLGSAFNDTLTGNPANNALDGGAGNDMLIGGDGFDTAAYASAGSAVAVNLALFGGQDTGGAGIDTLIDIENASGSAFNDTLIGNAGANTLSGLAGNDILDGAAGADVMIGGFGDDRYYIDSAFDQLFEFVDQGDDTAFVLGTYTLAQGVSVETLVALNQSSTDPLVLTGNQFGQSLYGNLGDNYLNGGQGADFLVGLDGNDNLLGGTGADHMQGGLGNDVYYVDEAGDLITELAGEGNDILVATASYTLGAGASIETMSAEQTNAAINLTGNELAQSLYGNAGDNILTGGGGADYMVGGAGNDKYYVDTSDFIDEQVGGGDDWIFVATSYTLREGNEIETLVAVSQDSTDPVNFSGNEFGQSLYGSQGANQLDGGAGNDFLVGLGGNDFLIGGAGNDNLQGGTGNDLYYVDSGDQIFENAGEGDDLAVAFANFTLGAGQSVETLTAAEGNAAINLTGNELGQSLYGNAGNNVLTSGGGADNMVGGAGNDVFVLTNAAGVATVSDYAAGDVVDIRQFLSVANGTNVVGGGYVRIVGTQLQIDANGGGDAFVTVGNVSGSGNVTIRYQSGGSPTDLSLSRSAGQTEALVSKLALDDGPAHASLLDGWHAGSMLHDTPGLDPIAPHFDAHGII